MSDQSRESNSEKAAGARHVVVAMTTWPADHDPEPFARALVEARLAACVNVLPGMLSVYAWKGNIESAGERQVLIKTTRRRLAALAERLSALHPYEVPEFIVLDLAGGSEAYLAWVEAEVG